LGPTSDLWDLLLDFGVEENEMEDALRNFKCPNCGTTLDIPTTDVEIKSAYDKKVEEVSANITAPAIKKQLEDFHLFLSKYPYLGASHALGAQLQNSIQHSKKGSFRTVPWYRARKFDADSRIFRADEMHAPKPEKVYVGEGLIDERICVRIEKLHPPEVCEVVH
jgi:hypothetical protein